MSDNSKQQKNIDRFSASDFEEELKRQTEEREKAREEHYRKKAERLGAEQGRSSELRLSGGDAAVYKAKAALKTHKEKPVRAEGAIHRTFRLIKGMRAVNKRIRSESNLTCEMKRELKSEVVRDAWQPLTDGVSEFEVNAWDFLTLLWDDIEEIILFIADMFIAAGYYIGSICLYIWDILWDLRLWLDERKKPLFQIFSASLTALAVVVIVISSLSGYEYSYYGRTLGISRSKQEVYSTIDALGDKLSAATGANINLDVERDISFKKVYGFNLNIDDKDDILNTLTYMKDIQVRAYAVSIDGNQAVIVENKEAADKLIDRVKEFFTPPIEGQEYTDIKINNVISVDEVGALLGDIWNQQDALNYILTGSYKGDTSVNGLHPLLNVSVTANYRYTEEKNFSVKYIDNSSLYADETELISQGVTGKTEVVETIEMVNGEEISRVVASTNKISNPVDAVYYKGTKPLPERKGTGSFIWPLKSYVLSSNYGARNTGIKGASTNHLGIDLAAPNGTKIYACDGGVVTFAGYRTGYGYVVFIDHGGLYETRYAHCSKLAVNKGDEIYQGQYIANVGSTGVSSGPHCHLEVLYKGVHINPITIVGK